MGSLRFLAAVGVAWCSFCAPVRAQTLAPAPPSRQQCLADHEHAQDQRLAGKLLEARTALRECSATACPALVSRDCVAWLNEVEQQIPTVIFRAAKDGEDVVALRVRADGQLLTESLTGTPLELDPGPHHFEAELSGFPLQAATYVLQAGDKGRVIRFDFLTPKPAAPPPSLPPPVAPAPLLWRPVPATTYVLGGVTLTAAVVGGVLGGLALAKRADVERDCAPLCTDRDVRSVKSPALAADISFAVALLGAGATVYTYVARPSVPLHAAHSPRLRVTLAGLALVARASF